ncbi:MAG TPA: hypothetical protein VM925_15860 [Labilithrix sp.]|nr:hypothetical protein [Labilithrix sp.]
MNLARGGALTALGLIVAVGCGGSDASPVPPGNGSGDGGDVSVLGPSGPDGGEPPGPPAPPPPPDGKPVEGIFVSASKGIEDADATMLRPVKTLARGMAIAAEKKTLPVIVCAETYNEAVKLPEGVTMYGYFDCSGAEWKQVSAHAKIVSPTSPAVLVENANLEARFEGFDVVAPDMAGAGPSGTAAGSSYGMIVKLVKHLHIAQVNVLAGKGQDGLDGVEPVAGNKEKAERPTGDSAGYQAYCPADPETCRLVTPEFTNGGFGGNSFCQVGPNGGPGGLGGLGPTIVDKKYRRSLTAAETSGAPIGGSAVTASGAASTGKLASNKGVDGAAGAAGAPGTSGLWSFTPAGFVPDDGTPGLNGSPGQGGGGGPGTNVCWYSYDTPFASPAEASAAIWGASGAGGGAGGCGGIAGTPGTGGGASVAMLIVGSEDIRIKDSRLEGKKGGRGGKGALGTLGTPGNAGGRGAFSGNDPNDTRPNGLYGGAGGRGGDGGAAGLSGHGAPGPSIALAFNGSRPLTTGVELVPGVGGDGAAALTRGSQTMPGTAGIAKGEHAF